MGNSNQHPWSHIAPGPYKFLGSESTEMRSEKYAERERNGLPTTSNLCGGTCYHCQTPIWNVCKFVASDGTVFVVGEDCVETAAEWEAGQRERFAALPAYIVAAQKSKKARQSKQRKARAAAKDAEARAWFSCHMDELRNMPHPSEYRAEHGETAADWAWWMLTHCGQSGVQKVWKQAKAMLG